MWKDVNPPPLSQNVPGESENPYLVDEGLDSFYLNEDQVAADKPVLPYTVYIGDDKEQEDIKAMLSELRKENTINSVHWQIGYNQALSWSMKGYGACQAYDAEYYGELDTIIEECGPALNHLKLQIGGVHVAEWFGSGPWSLPNGRLVKRRVTENENVNPVAPEPEGRAQKIALRRFVHDMGYKPHQTDIICTAMQDMSIESMQQLLDFGDNDRIFQELTNDERWRRLKPAARYYHEKLDADNRLRPGAARYFLEQLEAEKRNLAAAEKPEKTVDVGPEETTSEISDILKETGKHYKIVSVRLHLYAYDWSHTEESKKEQDEEAKLNTIVNLCPEPPLRDVKIFAGHLQIYTWPWPSK